MALEMQPRCLVKGLWPRFLAFAFSPAVVLGASLAVCGAADFYVATNGNDSNLGTSDQPFATLERGRDAIRSLKQTGPLPTGGTHVWLRGGRYMRQSPFTLSVYWSPVAGNDSGTPTSPVVYQAYPGETPYIIGGINVTGFQSVTDPTILARLTSSAQTNLLVANLSSQGITNILPLARYGTSQWWNWTGQAELFFNDHPMQLARWPNTNWLTIASSLAPGVTYFSFSGTNQNRWADVSDIWAAGYFGNDWAFYCDKVAGITNNVAYMTNICAQYGYKAGQRFFFLNILEELDSPGEYYIDRIRNLLYFWPASNITNGAPFISVAPNLVVLDAVSNIVLSGISFEGSLGGQGGMVEISRGQSNLVTGCTFEGGCCDAVDIMYGLGSGVSYCKLSDVGEQGIYMFRCGNRLTLTPGGNFATCNTIYNFSRLCRASNPAINVDSIGNAGVGNYIAHNLVYNAPHTGMQVVGNDNVVEYNEIHHVCTETSDAGALYMGHVDWTMRGNIVRYNYFHDINLFVGSANPAGVKGVYLDDYMSGVTIFGNVFCAVDQGVYIGGGRDNIVANNMFVDNDIYAIQVDQRGFSWDQSRISNTNSALWSSLKAMPYQTPPWSSEYPALVSIATNNPAAALGNIIQNNLSYSNTAWIGWLYGAQTNVTVTSNFTSGDPQFVSYAQRQFGLSTNSPVWALGFQPIPMNRFGPVPARPRGVKIVGPQ
jgi:hypothetical protein